MTRLPPPGRSAPGRSNGKPDPYWDILRINKGYTRAYADRMNLAAMTPQPAPASTGYCLAGKAEFPAYMTQGRSLTVDLWLVSGRFSVELFNPSTGAVVNGAPVAGGGKRALTAPFGGDAVLYLAQSAEGAKQ